MANENETGNDQPADESRNLNQDASQSAPFRVQGQAALESGDRVPGELQLTAYVFDNRGQLVGRGPVDAEGRYNLPVRLQQPADVELVIGPAGDPAQVREGETFSQSFSANEWVRGSEDRAFYL